MKSTNREISEQLPKGTLSFLLHIWQTIKWNILGDSPIIGKEQVIEVSKMLQVESFPVINGTNLTMTNRINDYFAIQMPHKHKYVGVGGKPKD